VKTKDTEAILPAKTKLGNPLHAIVLEIECYCQHKTGELRGMRTLGGLLAIGTFMTIFLILTVIPGCMASRGR